MLSLKKLTLLVLITYTHIDIITKTHLSYSFFHLKQNNLKKKKNGKMLKKKKQAAYQ